MRVALIDAHRDEHGVEPIGAQLSSAPSAYYEHKGRELDLIVRHGVPSGTIC